MRQVFFAALVCALAGLSSGCKLCQGLGWNGHGSCAQGGCGPGGCPDGACADGHTSPYEPMYHGHGSTPQRGGLFSQVNAGGPGIPAHGMGHGGMAHGGMGAGGMGAMGAGGMGAAGGSPPPSAGAVAYPYYTNRGPRDFLAPNPRGIGP